MPEKTNIKKAVDDIDKMFDEWENNEKRGAGGKIVEKKYHCPACGHEVDHEIDLAGLKVKDEEFDEIEEQMKFLDALEETIKQRNEELERSGIINIYSRKVMPDLDPLRVKRPNPFDTGTSGWPRAADTHVFSEVDFPRRKSKPPKVSQRVLLPGDVSRTSVVSDSRTIPGTKHVKLIRRSM